MGEARNSPDIDFPSNIGQPARNALVHAGYTRLEQLTEVRESNLKNMHGMGPKAIRLLADALAARSMAYAEDFPVKLPAPAQRALDSAGFTKLEHLNGIPLSKVKELHGMGPKALDALREALAARGMGFAEE